MYVVRVCFSTKPDTNTNTLINKKNQRNQIRLLVDYTMAILQ